MQTVRRDQPAVIQFPVVASGALVTGLPGGAFAVTVVSPDNNTLTGLAVSETAKPGVYTFTVPSSFWAHGAGGYVYTVEQSAPAPTGVFFDWVDVIDAAGTVGVSATYDAPANLVRVNAWLSRDQGVQTALVGTCVVQLWSETGASLAGPLTAASPDANGVFRVDLTAPAFLIGETATYLSASIIDSSVPIRTVSTVVGVTFSRTS